MEDIPIQKLSPLAVKELGRHLDRGECEEGTWREFAGYAYGATLGDILEIESRQDSPTRFVFNSWYESHSDLTVGHLVKLLKLLGRSRAIDGLQGLYQDGGLAAVHQSPTHQSIPSTSSSTPSMTTDPSSNNYSNRSSARTSDITILLSYAGSMFKQIKCFELCLSKATGYNIELDQIKPSAWVNQEQKEKQLHEKFQHALFVICLIDEEYVHEANGESTRPEMQTNTRFIMQLMSDEFNEKGENSRFLPYFLDAKMTKTFPQFLANPPLGPYEHFQYILAEELKRVQLEKQELERVQLEERHMRVLRIDQTGLRNVNKPCHNPHQNITLSDQSIYSSCEGSSSGFILTKKNRNCREQVVDRNTNGGQITDSDESSNTFRPITGNRNLQERTRESNIKVKIQPNTTSKFKFNFFKSVIRSISLHKPRKATETQLIIHKTVR